MNKLVPGQRWISDTEPELGLGTLTAMEGNRLSLLFIAAGERRTYAADNAPLSRVRFAPGDRIETVDGAGLTVLRVEERNGLLTYWGAAEDGEVLALEEVELNHQLRFSKPLDRLFNGQVDASSLFRLRCQAQAHRVALERSPVRGLLGPRTSLIPHQLYIAHEVARRHAPRVLLADEVGLGKTIEAGLILHQLLLSGRAERVLILVPEPLLHQWLVEMLRRFHLRFSLFDEERCGDRPGENPFVTEQLILSSPAFFRGEPELQAQALEAGWDLCVVDEAHHLQCCQGPAGEDYRFVERVAAAVPGLLLLTATPEQLGKESHFARLRLLDPDRFFSYGAFLEEERRYEPLAELLERLTEDEVLSPAILERVKEMAAEDQAEEWISRLDDPGQSARARQALINLLLDRHGTGRILFRNTRATVQGFPERQLQAYPLPLPELYAGLPTEAVAEALYPESVYRTRAAGEIPWWREDGRVAWLVDTLRSIRPAKTLVICAGAQTAMDLDEALRVLGGIGAAVFHERLSILARDRAAAWFADEEEGAQVLVCSEIGSEGRNFQFAHHLVLFDLPLNPDLLEQRIGRLDRIGQGQTIRIHVPYLAGSAQEALFRWYGEGLEAFTRPCPAAGAVFSKLGGQLEQLLLKSDEDRLVRLLEEARSLNGEILEALHKGRDRLLELNSCRVDQAEALLQAIRATERQDSLWPFLEEVFDAFGVTVEEHSANAQILLPGDHMRISHFPELPEDGVTVTLDRGLGLAREDLSFLSWEHPMVTGALDLILNGEQGNAAFALLRHGDLPPGLLLLEAVFLVEVSAPKGLAIGRYLPEVLVRRVLDRNGKDWSHFPLDSAEPAPERPDGAEISEFLKGQRKTIEGLLSLAEDQAGRRLPEIIAEASRDLLDQATGELKRLAVLRKLNPAVRQEELDRLKADTLARHGAIQAARVRLDAVRIVVSG